MQLGQAKNRAEAANKVALEAEKEKDDAVEELKRQLQPKRARTHGDAGDADADEMLAEVDNWELSVHRQWVTRVQNRFGDGDCAMLPRIRWQ